MRAHPDVDHQSHDDDAVDETVIVGRVSGLGAVQ